MSKVTNYVILVSNHDDYDNLGKLNIAIANVTGVFYHEFKEVGKHAGGSKYLEAEVWALAGNHLPEAIVIGAIKSILWDDPVSLVVFAASEDDPNWTQWDVFGTGRPMANPKYVKMLSASIVRLEVELREAISIQASMQKVIDGLMDKLVLLDTNAGGDVVVNQN